MKKIMKYTLAGVLTLIIASLLTEAILGIIFHFKDRRLEPMAVHDYPYLYYLFDQAAGLNEHGFKTNYPMKKQPGKFRIILTGGSVARGKLPKESIANYLEKELNARLNTDRIEVINAGMSAYVAEQEFLLTQLILQYYEPDMLISLNGYNDWMTFRLNRQHPSEFALPPHNWHHFGVIKENRERKKFLTRFPLFFRNIFRAVRFYERRKFEKNYDWAALSDERLKPFSDTYWQIIDDTYAFCKAKNITYFSFLQPVKPYAQAPEAGNAQSKAMSRLYRLMDEGTRDRFYAFSLTSLFNSSPHLFTDDCHVTSAGNRMIANAMADRVADEAESRLNN